MKEQSLNVFNDLYRSSEMYYGWEPRKEFQDYISNVELTGKTVLDLGCGEGRYSIYLAERGCSVTSVDMSHVGLNKLRLNAKQRHLQVQTYLRDVADYEFPECKFDLVIAATLLDHLDDIARPKVISGIKRTLKHEGVAFISVFTTHDPGYKAGVEILNGDEKHNVSDTSVCIEHYFRPNELREKFNDFDVLYYYEGIEPDFQHGTPHHHGWASVIARKPAKDK
ncbi:MAG TPA: class I SAM-dependent methyltransferase [Thermodesulfobacteriota bacterium]|nr:class I SAM-dependent methyltransferase [Thermodesulfobacteriota bacterium]